MSFKFIVTRQIAPEYISTHQIQKFFWGGGPTPPQTPPPVGRGTPLPTPLPLGAYGASIFAPAALRLGAYGASILAPTAPRFLAPLNFFT